MALIKQNINLPAQEYSHQNESCKQDYQMVLEELDISVKTSIIPVPCPNGTVMKNCHLKIKIVAQKISLHKTCLRDILAVIYDLVGMLYCGFTTNEERTDLILLQGTQKVKTSHTKTGQRKKRTKKWEMRNPTIPKTNDLKRQATVSTALYLK